MLYFDNDILNLFSTPFQSMFFMYLPVLPMLWAGHVGRTLFAVVFAVLISGYLPRLKEMSLNVEHRFKYGYRFAREKRQSEFLPPFPTKRKSRTRMEKRKKSSGQPSGLYQCLTFSRRTEKNFRSCVKP